MCENSLMGSVPCRPSWWCFPREMVSYRSQVRVPEEMKLVVVLELVPDGICVVLEGLLKEHLKWSIGGLAGCLSLRVTVEPHPMSMLPTVHIKT
jgi:hypothetical protein